MTVRSPVSSSPRSGDAVALPVQRHRRHPVAQVHPAADPGSLGGVVLPALRRAHLAQLGVDGGAVVALVVVLGQDLPVGAGVVLVLPGHLQPAHLVRRDVFGQRAQRVRERGGRPRCVHEHQAVPLGHRQLDEPPLAGHEARLVQEAGGRQYPAAQRIGPRVVGADDGLALRGPAAGQQLVAAVAAGVGERTAARRPRRGSSRTLPLPAASARWSPGSGSCSLRPTHTQPPPKK